MAYTNRKRLDRTSIEDKFVINYTGFTDFQTTPQYRPYWDLCMEAALDEELLSHIIFCNDFFAIPPVKTFLTVFTDEIILIMGGQANKLPPRLKQGIGAFWGSVFKFNLSYSQQKSISASTKANFGLKTATFFWDRSPGESEEGSEAADAV